MNRATNLLLAAILAGSLAGCSIRSQTVTPPRVVTTEASFDGGKKDSGLREIEPTGIIVSAHWIARYDAMLEKYGKRFTPEVKPGDRTGIKAVGPNFSVTPEVSVRFTRMNTWRKNEQAVIRPLVPVKADLPCGGSEEFA